MASSVFKICGNLLTLSAICLLIQTVSASYFHSRWGYSDDNTYIRYECISRRWNLYADGCTYTPQGAWDDIYGCCATFNTTVFPRVPVKLTCPLAGSGTTCIDGEYVKSKHIDKSDRSFMSSNKWSQGSTTTAHIIDPYKGASSRSGSIILTVIGSVIGGLLLLVGLIVCCCKCGSCSEENRREAIAAAQRPTRPHTTRTSFFRPRWLILIFSRTSSRPANAPPAYERLDEEKEMNGSPVLPPTYNDAINEGSSSAPY